MNGELSGEKNGITYERLDTPQRTAYIHMRKPMPMNFSAVDIVFSFAILLCGFLYWNLIQIVSLGLGVTLFTAVLSAATWGYLHAAGLRQSVESLAFLGIVIMSAANFTLFDGIPLKALNFIFLSLSFVYWVCLTAGTRLENKISLYILNDMLRQMLVIPFANFTGCFSATRHVFMKNQKGKGLASGFLGILLFLPVLIIVTTLLINADAAFESLMDQLRFSVSEHVLEYLRDIILGVPVACYLYGLIYGNRYKRGFGDATPESVHERMKVLRFAPDPTVYSALTALNLIYTVFFLAQAGYLFSAFQDSLPQSMTYAEYARRGFFELCAVSAINLAVIAAAHLIAKRDRIKILKAETAALCIFTVALIATAMSKMAMYIEYYGLTRLRAYPSWFMIILLFLFIIILLRQFRSFQGTRIAAVGCICLFMALSYANVDGLIAKYNIERYQAGTLESLDLDAMSELSDGAVPHLYELYQETPDAGMKDDIRTIIIERPVWENSDTGYQNSFRDFNLQTYKADQIRDKI